MSEHKRGKGIYGFLRKQTFRHLMMYYALLYRIDCVVQKAKYIPNLFLQNCNHKRGIIVLIISIHALYFKSNT